MANHYRILGIPETASEDEIRQAYTRLAVEYHPAIDRSNKSRFQDIQIAYLVLSDPTERAVYDAGREEVDISLFTMETLFQVFHSRRDAEERAIRNQRINFYCGIATIGIAPVVGSLAVHSYRENSKSVGNTCLGVALFLAGAGVAWIRRSSKKRKEHEREKEELTKLIERYKK